MSDRTVGAFPATKCQLIKHIYVCSVMIGARDLHVPNEKHIFNNFYNNQQYIYIYIYVRVVQYPNNTNLFEKYCLFWRRTHVYNTHVQYIILFRRIGIISKVWISMFLHIMILFSIIILCSLVGVKM